MNRNTNFNETVVTTVASESKLVTRNVYLIKKNSLGTSSIKECKIVSVIANSFIVEDALGNREMFPMSNEDWFMSYMNAKRACDSRNR